MSGGTEIPYGNVKNMYVLTATPSGTSVSIGTTGTVVTLTVPGLLPGDCILDVNRPSNTINGNASPAVPWVTVGNAYVSAANTLNVVFG